MNQDSMFLLKKLSIFLNDYSKEIKKGDIQSLMPFVETEKEAYMFMLASLFGLDIEKEDKSFFYEYFPKLVHHLDVKDYYTNPYLKNIKFPNIKEKNWEFKMDKYEPYEAFVCNDFLNTNDKIIPQIGFFNEEYTFPAVYQNNRLWMSIIPNEINTMEEDIASSHGNLLVCGLGLGYFPYMTSLDSKVLSITIIEKDKTVIDMFKTYILPQFENKEKIQIIEADAIDYLNGDLSKYDTVYIDLWHDVSDGLPIYKSLLSLRNKYKKKDILFWIEKTLKCYAL